MTEDHKVSNDNCANKRTVKKTFKDFFYADVGKSCKDLKKLIDDAAPEKNEVVHWNNFSPK
jgi:hypothetical protein